MKIKKTRLLKIYEFADKLGIQKNEVDLIIDKNFENEKIFLSIGPPWYPGGHYGTISIKDFS